MTATEESKHGVVIRFDANKLRQRYSLEEYHDPHMAKKWNEEELRIWVEVLPNALDYVIGLDPIHQPSIRPY